MRAQDVLLAGLGAALALAAPGAPRAQTEENAVTQARDAFGQRIGEEAIGLYGENQVRGFDLATTASHRIDGAYFIREFQVPDVLTQGVRVNVGIAAARLHFPSPSGVADYQLKGAEVGDRFAAASFGLRDFGTPFLELDAAYAAADGRSGIAAGLDLSPGVNWPDRREGFTHAVGVMPHVTLGEALRVRGLASLEVSNYNGNVNVASAAAAVPPKLPVDFYGVPWGRNERFSTNLGVLVDGPLADDWFVTGSLFKSVNERTPQDFTLLGIFPDRTADVTYFRALRQRGRSITGEGLVGRRWTAGRLAHELAAGGRLRDSRVLTESITPVRFAGLDLLALNYPPMPELGPATNGTTSDVAQRSASLSYAGSYADAVELRVGAHRVRYDKEASAFAGPASRRVERSWSYNASLVVAAGDALTLFATAIRGLEESGLAPQSALNRNEVLPPVTATTREIGFRAELGDTLALTASGFSIKKQIPGLRADGIYALIGDVEHRGVEASLSGRIALGTSLVAGATALRPRLSGPLVDAGTAGARPVGVSRTTAVLGLDHRFLAWPDWSLDTRITWQGPRAANVANSFTAPGVATLSVGGRYRFAVGARSGLVRVAASNLFTSRPYTVGSNGLFTPGPPFTVRASVRLSLTPDLDT
jgi:iron complex outermembrane receptor protein